MARQQTEIKVPRETTGGRMLIERLAVGRGSLLPSSIVKRGERKVGTRGSERYRASSPNGAGCVRAHNCSGE